MKRLPWGLVLLVVLVTLVAGACGGSDDGGDASAGGFDSSQEAEGLGDAEEAAGDGYTSYGEAADDDGGSREVTDTAAPRSTMSLPQSGPNVIKTADLQLEVERDTFQDAFQDVIDIAGRRGGFVLSSRVGGEKARRGSVTIRVPSETFESAVGEIKQLGTLTHESSSGQDVTEEFVDLQARIRHLKSQEAVMLGLMRQATTIPDTIRIQNELTGIQLEVERLRGRLRYLEDQTTLSTITVGLNEVGTAPVVEKEDPGTLEEAWNVLRDTTNAIVSTFLIGGAALAPILVLLLMGYLVFRWLRPRLGKVAGS